MSKSTETKRIADLNTGDEFTFSDHTYTYVSHESEGRGKIKVHVERDRYFLCGINSKCEVASVKRGRPEIGIELDAPIEVAASAAGVFIVTEISGPKSMQGRTATLAMNADDMEALVHRLIPAITYAREAAKAQTF